MYVYCIVLVLSMYKDTDKRRKNVFTRGWQSFFETEKYNFRKSSFELFKDTHTHTLTHMYRPGFLVCICREKWRHFLAFFEIM